MKMFKLILCCVIPTLLVISIILNVLLLCGFKFTRETSKVDEPTNITQTVINDKDIPKEDSYDSLDNNNRLPEVTQKLEETSITSDEEVGKVIYDDTNIKVTYVSTQKIDEGIVHNFKIENLTKKTLSINFTDVIINGTRVYISGLTCENLLPETSTVEEFVLYDKDYDSFTEDPSDISFKIELVNSKSRLDWYESNLITMKF